MRKLRPTLRDVGPGSEIGGHYVDDRPGKTGVAGRCPVTRYSGAGIARSGHTGEALPDTAMRGAERVPGTDAQVDCCPAGQCAGTGLARNGRTGEALSDRAMRGSRAPAERAHRAGVARQGGVWGRARPERARGG
ncbi:hypothetical protein Ate02nite_85940 [Paractinoplanes tereljensis]|uniref:Uncharacterized protein n=1 Tax=Paractinoplanes tereljensis TaxID=571912 RepID=A0A919TY65_9ACTN|nr:hypothetical protein Ate02nite_85940 [Actinoplanes tereljensis]